MLSPPLTSGGFDAEGDAAVAPNWLWLGRAEVFLLLFVEVLAVLFFTLLEPVFCPVVVFPFTWLGPRVAPGGTEVLRSVLFSFAPVGCACGLTFPVPGMLPSMAAASLSSGETGTGEPAGFQLLPPEDWVFDCEAVFVAVFCCVPDLVLSLLLL